MTYCTFEPLPPESLEDLNGKFSGYASCYTKDLLGDEILPEAFEEALQDFYREKRLWLLWQHEPGWGPIGVVESMELDHRGLRVDGQVFLWKPLGMQALGLLKNKELTGLSIGFIPRDYLPLPEGGRLISRLSLQEISLVYEPANPFAEVVSVKRVGDYVPP